MSEYQYYEFNAIDRPLTAAQQAELRACSTRARITATSFCNEYHWGDLKGEPIEWMARYFDAHVYSSNWGRCDFMLGLPRDMFDGATAAQYTAGAGKRSEYGGGAFTMLDNAGRWIVIWSLELDDGGEDERFWAEDGPGWMDRLRPLRDELLRGDMRPLYLGWMASLCSCELDDDALEPPVPPGLGSLTEAQAALVEFLAIDPDLLTVAAAASAEAAPRDEAAAAAAWIAQLPEPELRLAVGRIMQQGGQATERGLRAQLAQWRRLQRTDGTPAPAPARTVAKIEAGRAAAEQLRLEQERRRQQVRLARELAERTRHLTDVAARAEAIWAEIDALLQRGTGAAYEQAQRAVVELSAALAANGRGDEFRRGLARQLSAHGTRPAWLARLRKAGLM
jgi:hypothetical protein